MENITVESCAIIAGGNKRDEYQQLDTDLIYMQYFGDLRRPNPVSQIIEVTCPVDMLWYCAAQDFGSMCARAGGGLSGEPDGGVTCTVYD